MSLDDFRTLGRSGLAVSPLALGAMTFGTARWGTGDQASRDVFNAYLDAGGNFVDTADVYAGGRSEEMVGRFIAERGVRDRVVVATKAGFAVGKGVHAGGSSARHLHGALDGSLRRLGTDYVDLYWMHVWDSLTPAEELLETMTALVRSGKIRYCGMSNAPAWYVAKVATLAAVRGMPGPIALQYFYSLVNRNDEDEHLPLAAEFGMGVTGSMQSARVTGGCCTISSRRQCAVWRSLAEMTYPRGSLANAGRASRKTDATQFHCQLPGWSSCPGRSALVTS